MVNLSLTDGKKIDRPAACKKQKNELLIKNRMTKLTKLTKSE